LTLSTLHTFHYFWIRKKGIFIAKFLTKCGEGGNEAIGDNCEKSPVAFSF